MESRVIEGWRARSQREIADARSAFYSVERSVIYEEITSSFHDQSQPFGQSFRRHVFFGSDRDEAYAKLNSARLRAAFNDHPEWSDKGYTWESVRKRLYWFHLDKKKKAKRIAAMTEYNRTYRAKNREATNARARQYAAKNKEVINAARRIARAQLPKSEASKVNFQAAIYQQFLALAGLAPWQKKK